jgi:hypothetical protein
MANARTGQRARGSQQESRVRREATESLALYLIVHAGHRRTPMRRSWHVVPLVRATDSARRRDPGRHRVSRVVLAEPAPLPPRIAARRAGPTEMVVKESMRLYPRDVLVLCSSTARTLDSDICSLVPKA